MKIAVFNCPRGVTGEGILQAFLDAGLPRSVITKARNDVMKKTALALCYFKIKKCFLRNLAIGKKGDPRTLKLLGGFILNRISIHREIVTQEGARILASICEKDEAIPATRLEKVGFGPHQLMVSIGETVAPFRRDRILLLETNIDDMNPQGFELLYERLFKAGALDVWVQPIMMKKMRPAFKLSVLFNHRLQDQIAETVFRETPTLGVRFFEMDRFSLPRKSIRTKTRYGNIRLKMGYLDSTHSVASPEYDDVKRIAKRQNLPFHFIREKIKKDSRQ